MRPIRAMIASGRGTGPVTFSDDFSTNTIANYTVTQDSGTPSWAISSGLLSAGGVTGMQSICRRNSFSQADVFVECDTSFQKDGGIVARFVDQNNFYLLALSDDSGTNPTQNLRLFKRVAGTFTQLGSSVNATFTRTTTHTFRLTCVGTSITAYMDGVSQIAVTDSGITSAGAIGARSNTDLNSDTFDVLRWG